MYFLLYFRCICWCTTNLCESYVDQVIKINNGERAKFKPKKNDALLQSNQCPCWKPIFSKRYHIKGDQCGNVYSTHINAPNQNTIFPARYWHKSSKWKTFIKIMGSQSPYELRSSSGGIISNFCPVFWVSMKALKMMIDLPAWNCLKQICCREIVV